jgi:hypothetical protein
MVVEGEDCSGICLKRAKRNHKKTVVRIPRLVTQNLGCPLNAKDGYSLWM